MKQTIHHFPHESRDLGGRCERLMRRCLEFDTPSGARWQRRANPQRHR
jgi:hypothetical protein